MCKGVESNISVYVYTKHLNWACNYCKMFNGRGRSSIVYKESTIWKNGFSTKHVFRFLIIGSVFKLALIGVQNWTLVWFPQKLNMGWVLWYAESNLLCWCWARFEIGPHFSKGSKINLVWYILTKMNSWDSLTHIWCIFVLYDCFDSTNKFQNTIHATRILSPWGKVEKRRRFTKVRYMYDVIENK